MSGISRVASRGEYETGERSQTGPPPRDKKTAPFEAVFFKEAKWRESEESQFDAAPGEWNGQSGIENIESEVFQRSSLFSYPAIEHLPHQIG
jgi:hypothetical protein